MKFIENIEQTSYFPVLHKALESVFATNDMMCIDDCSSPFIKNLYIPTFNPQIYFNNSDIKYAFGSFLYNIGFSLNVDPFDCIPDVELMELLILAIFCNEISIIDKRILPSLLKRDMRIRGKALECAWECSLDNGYEEITDMIESNINSGLDFESAYRISKFILTSAISKDLHELISPILEKQETLDFAKHDIAFIDDAIQTSIKNEKPEITAMLIDYKYKNNLHTEKKWEL